VRRTRGMSLIELLVLVVILSVIAGIAVVGLAGAGGERQLEREARRLQALLALACERAQLGGREHGIHLGSRGYGFSLPTANGWRRVPDGELRPRELPDGFTLAAERDGRELELEREPGEEPQSLCAPSGELLPFSARLAVSSLPAWTVRAQADGRIDLLPPDPAP
jgi:general secretion pathway protein H